MFSRRAVALAFFFAGCLASNLAAQFPVSYSLESDSDEVPHLTAALEKKVTFEFKGTPFKDAIAEVADKCDINIVITKKIEDAGVEPDQPVNIKLKNVKLRTFLKLLLGDLNLTWMLKDEVIKITTIEDAQAPENKNIRIYPVQDLLDPLPKDKDGKVAFDYGPLIELINVVVEPDSWEDVGGPGSVREFSNAGSIIIAQREDLHDLTGRLLTTLRKAKAAQGLPKPTVAVPNRYLQSATAPLPPPK